MRYNRKVADALLNICENNEDVWIYRRNDPHFEVTYHGHRVHWTMRCQVEENTLHLKSRLPVHIPPTQIPTIQKCINGINKDFSLGQFEMKINRNALSGEVYYKTQICMTSAGNMVRIIAEQLFIHRLTVENYLPELMRIAYGTTTLLQETERNEPQEQTFAHQTDGDTSWASKMDIPLVGQMPNFGWFPTQIESRLPISKA